MDVFFHFAFFCGDTQQDQQKEKKYKFVSDTKVTAAIAHIRKI